MKSENISEFNDEQLVKAFKSLKTNKIIDAFIIGLTIGVFLYSAVNNGFGFFTFFPLIIGYLIIKNLPNKKLLENEIMKEMKVREIDINTQ